MQSVPLYISVTASHQNAYRAKVLAAHALLLVNVLLAKIYPCLW